MSDNKRKKFESSFKGKIKEISDISVDNFRSKMKKAYFLSHVHADHTVSLNKMDAAKEKKIYMSEQSKTILSFKNKLWKKISTMVVALETGIPHFIGLGDSKSLKVTLIPATHMIGASMFLFEINGKTILYTGDFTICEDKDEIKKIKELHFEGKPIKIHTLYVDSTFNDAYHMNFPNRKSAEREIVQKAEDWLKAANHSLVLLTKYQFAYEDIYQALHKKLGKKILINKMTKTKSGTTDSTIEHEIYEKLYGTENFTTKDRKSKIIVHICENDSHDRCEFQKFTNDIKCYIKIYAAAGYQRHQRALVEKRQNMYHLTYSSHCSKTQLDFFIDYLKPDRTERFPVKSDDLTAAGVLDSTPTTSRQSQSARTPRKRQNVNSNTRQDNVKKRLKFELTRI